MIEHTYKVPFEDYPAANGDYLDGNAIIRASRYEWDIVGIEVFAGRNGFVLVEIADHELITQIREYLEARPSWTDAADLEWRAYFPPTPRRPRLVPAWVE